MPSLFANIRVVPSLVEDENHIKNKIAKELNIKSSSINSIRLLKRSIDARQKQVYYNLRYEVSTEDTIQTKEIVRDYKNVNNSEFTVHIIGSGPAGLFAALRAIELGIKPIVFERGKDVRERRRDLAKINKEHEVNGESNYCFGEGGAGTYSDGKLYTRSKKKGNVLRGLETLIFHGANDNIIIDAHPHIGTNKLPKIIENIREQILSSGGEIHFNSKLTDFEVEKGKFVNITINKQENIPVENIIVATGHSARDIFGLFDTKKLEMEFKPFALGVRAEHPQAIIDTIQYHCEVRDENLPPASYSLVTQTGNHGVYSFCMCPGGIIAPCATSPGEVVTNGWSPSKRNNPFANSGVVVEVKWEDIPEFHQYGALAGVKFQSYIEQKAWKMAGETQKVPAQRMIDFVNGVQSNDLPKTSYQPGVVSVDLNKLFPEFIAKSLRNAFTDFGKKMKGYLTNEAVLHATESRTSSPIRIPRTETLEHPQAKGLYPCGEGAGYAGGIMSAAIDGERCVNAIAEKLNIN